jgi:hypothetical protein
MDGLTLVEGVSDRLNYSCTSTHDDNRTLLGLPWSRLVRDATTRTLRKLEAAVLQG